MVQWVSELDALVEDIVTQTRGKIVLGLPLGLGKPVQFVNALYARAKADTSITLTILTALSLAKPKPKSSIEKAFLDPLLDRVFGDYEELLYLDDLNAQTVPDNIVIEEFFFVAGSRLKNTYAQRHYISANYTHVSRDLVDKGVNVLAQLISTNILEESKVSLACNPEVSLELESYIDQQRASKEPMFVVGQRHPDLPYMGNDAEVPEDMFDYIIDAEKYNKTLFAPPNQPVSMTDYAIGLHASALVKDGGTLQIGIGALGDAVVHALVMRHRNNQDYSAMLDSMVIANKPLLAEQGDRSVFNKGLYGCSEMFVPGFMVLREAGILTRAVADDVSLETINRQGDVELVSSLDLLDRLLENKKIHQVLTEYDVSYLISVGIFKDEVQLTAGKFSLSDSLVDLSLSDEASRLIIATHCLTKRGLPKYFMHGGFFVGNQNFYDTLNALSKDEKSGINMTRIGYVNELYGNTELKVLQRKDARFINTLFSATLLGAGISDGLEDGRVLSGVGGQYNFVSQAHELEGARSVLLLRSARGGGDEATSNIVFNYGHTTIPRHLRDIVITEYGIADLRGKSDENIVKEMLNITDSRFQNTLMLKAKQAGKLDENYQIPEMFANNTPERLAAVLRPYEAVFPKFPFGSDLNVQEKRLAKALLIVKAKSSDKMALFKAFIGSGAKAEHLNDDLERLGLANAKDLNLKDRIARRLIIDALDQIA